MQKVKIPISIEDAFRLSKIKHENPNISVRFLLEEGIKHLFNQRAKSEYKHAEKV